jgi:hypothetical protein
MDINKVACDGAWRLSNAGLVIHTTPTEVRRELFDGKTQTNALNHPHP